MTADVLTLIVAIALPIVPLVALGGLIVGLGELERRLDELIELGS